MLSVYPWQQAQWSRLQAAIAGNRIPHALLLSGPEGLGLGHFATALAGALLCEQDGIPDPCGECRGCRLFQAGNHPDYLRIEPEEPGKAIRVDAIRELIQYLQLHSQYGGYKIAVLDPADAMNRSAANTLLKTLEEPPPGNVLILNSSRVSQLPVTVRSRCQQTVFTSENSEATRQWLASQLGDGRERADELLTLSRGRPLAALALEQEGVLEQQTQILNDLLLLARGEIEPVATANRWLAHDAAVVLQWLLTFIPMLAHRQLQGAEQVRGELEQGLQALAEGLDLVPLLKWYDIVLSNYRAATGPYNLNKQGLLEEVIVTWQKLSQAGRRS